MFDLQRRLPVNLLARKPTITVRATLTLSPPRWTMIESEVSLTLASVLAIVALLGTVLSNIALQISAHDHAPAGAPST